MDQQIYHLEGFSVNYNKLEKEKKKSALKALQFILEINKSVGFDEILVRQGFQTYPKKSEIEAKRKEETFLAFFNYLKENLNTIESNYLRDTNDLKLIEQAQSTNQKEYNFLLNKNSVSKFVRDEASHYQKVLDQYLQAINEEQKGVKTKNMHSFLIELFTNRCIVIIHSSEIYFKKPISEIQVDIGNHLFQYAKKLKEFTDEQAKEQFFISEEQILDFLTFWLKQQSKMFILYARTSERLNKESKFITNQAHLTSIIHPSRMTAEEIVERQEQIELVKQEQLAKSHIQDNPPAQEINKEINKGKEVQSHDYRTLNLKVKVPESQKIQRKQSQGVIENKMQKTKSKEELLKGQLKSLFEFGCKRRYKLNKNSTFEDIQQQSQTMTLEKFINFCNFFELTTIITRELVSEYFKMFALNLRTLDFPRFQKVITKMIKIDQRIAQNLLKKMSFEMKLKRNHIKVDKKSSGRLSNYKFMLYPINGKDISSMERELSFRKLEKTIAREEKQKRALTKREDIEREPPKVSSRIVPNFSQNKISPVELEPIRDVGFNPQKLISNSENDKLWDAYEAKIWNRDQKSQSALQSILSRRIERGNIVIHKLNSQRSFIYDQ